MFLEYQSNTTDFLSKGPNIWGKMVYSFSSVAQSCLTLCDPMNLSTPGLPVHHQLPEFTHSHPSSQWCHPAISSWGVPFSFCPQSLPASESFPMSQLFAWGGQSTGVSALASFLPKKSQGWSPSPLKFVMFCLVELILLSREYGPSDF